MKSFKRCVVNTRKKLTKALRLQCANLLICSRAFSLVEMLMALLVASLLLAALAPVMTKRMQDTYTIKGNVPATKSKTVYLTDVGTHEWDIPLGIYNFTVTTVGGGGGGGAGMNYGCSVFTTTSVSQNSILPDDSYCTHVRGDGNISFTLPEGVDEIYVSMIGGAGGGGGGNPEWSPEQSWSTQGTYNWNVTSIVKGNGILVKMSGAGGGGGGSDQGGGGGGASGGFVNWTMYNVAASKTSIPVIVGGGGKGGTYWNRGTGKGGYNGGENAATGTGGGGGGGASSFDGAITAFGGGGGASASTTNCGWRYLSGDMWKSVFNYGGGGTQGGLSGPYQTYGGASGGKGASGGGIQIGGNGQNGYSGSDNTPVIGTSRGGSGGIASSISGLGTGGYGMDNCATYGGGAGGGGGASAFANGTSAPTGCIASNPDCTNLVKIAKAGTGAGGAGGSCGWNHYGSQTGGEGGDGIVILKYLNNKTGGGGGQSGPVVPRSVIKLTNPLKAGETVTVNVGKGGAGGDKVIAYSNNGTVEIRTVNSSGTISGNTDLSSAHGKPGTQSTLSFGANMLATTGSGGCGGAYNNGVNGPCSNKGTHIKDGTAINMLEAWHGHQSGSCRGNFNGSAEQGGEGTALIFDAIRYCSPLGGTINTRNGINGSIGLGGSGGYTTGYGGKGGDGYIKIEWGIPRNIDKSESVKYSGGGGSAGETKTSKITVSPVTRKIKYTIGKGGQGGHYNTTLNKLTDGYDGEDTAFGIGQSYSFKASGGKGGKRAKINSVYDSYFIVQTLTGTHGAGGISDCTLSDKLRCPDTMNGKEGKNNEGGRGGNSSTGEGASGGTTANANGTDAKNFDGYVGGGGGGGGGSAKSFAIGKGGKGADGYIKIQWND